MKNVRPRKIRLSRLQNTMLWLLEEAGAEELVILLKTFVAVGQARDRSVETSSPCPKPGRRSVFQDLAEGSVRVSLGMFSQALDGLLGLGFVKYYKDHGVGARYFALSADQVRALPATVELLRTYAGPNHTWVHREASPVTGIMLTEEGEASLTR